MNLYKEDKVLEILCPRCSNETTILDKHCKKCGFSVRSYIDNQIKYYNNDYEAGVEKIPNLKQSNNIQNNIKKSVCKKEISTDIKKEEKFSDFVNDNRSDSEESKKAVALVGGAILLFVIIMFIVVELVENNIII